MKSFTYTAAAETVQPSIVSPPRDACGTVGVDGMPPYHRPPVSASKGSSFLATVNDVGDNLACSDENFFMTGTPPAPSVSCSVCLYRSV